MIPKPLLRSQWAVLAVVLLAASAAWAEPPEPPPFYAIRNVTVVSGAGAPIEGATVLLADGLVEAVGKRVEVPADAWVIDGEGLNLYPGLIDGLSTLGQKKEEGATARAAGPATGGPPRGGPTIRGPEDRPQTTPWVAAADSLGQDSRVEKWRKAGFTAAVTAPTEGLFAGQAAVINLGGSREAKETIVATPVALRLNFRTEGRSRSYPGSLMGSLAYIKQVFSDTAHYTEAKAIYAAAPAGLERPTYDRTLEFLETTRTNDLPFLMPANLGREIDRALALAGEYDLPAVIYGGQGAYSRVDALAESGTPVLVSLNWPKAEKDRDPESDTSLRTLYHRRMAPATPAKLAGAGVPFGLYSDGLALPSEIFKKVRVAIDAGLDNRDALVALTSGPAGILGVSERVGTIESGKIANLILATDWPWAEGVEIEAVFVDGRKYEERKSEEPSRHDDDRGRSHERRHAALQDDGIDGRAQLHLVLVARGRG